jgi:hypothetical protein
MRQVRRAGRAACRLSDRQLAQLRAALDTGMPACGWDEDQRWTPARVTTLIARLFHVQYSLRVRRATFTLPRTKPTLSGRWIEPKYDNMILINQS